MKNNKTMLIFGIMFLVMINISIADTDFSSDSYLVSYWSMDTDASDKMGNYDGTPTNSPTHQASGCARGGCYDFNGADNEYIALGDLSGEFGNNASMMCWIKLDANDPGATDNGHWDFKTLTDGCHYTYDSTTTHHEGTFTTPGNRHNGITANQDKTAWHQLAITSTEGANGYHIYYNDNSAYFTGTGLAAGLVGTNSALGDSYATNRESYGINGMLDECAIWNRELSAAEVSQLYDCVVAGTAIDECGMPAVPISINLSSTIPVNATNFNTLPIDFNATGNFSQIANCSLYIDSIVNATLYGFTGVNQKINFRRNVSDGIHHYYISCKDETSTVSTSSLLFLVDFETPQLSETTFINNSLWYRGNITGQFNITDNILLHSINVSIDNVKIYDILHAHITEFTYNLSKNANQYSVGKHTLNFIIKDGHTATELKNPYDYNAKTSNILEYDIKGVYSPTKIEIFQLDKNKGDVWTSTYNGKDRYTETYRPIIAAETQRFKVKSNQEIYIATNKAGKYGGSWLIIGDHWKDFVLSDEPEAKIKITQLSKNEVDIEITGIKNRPNLLSFESTGDLNVLNVTYNFYVVNMTYNNPTPIISGYSDTFNLTVSLGTFELDISSITPYAIFEWNNTNYTLTPRRWNNNFVYFNLSFPTEIITTTLNYPNRWLFNFSSYTKGTTILNNDGYINTSDQNTLVQTWGMDNCSRFNFTTIRMTIYDEEHPTTTLNSTMEIDSVFWIDSLAINQTYNFKFDGNYSYKLCIDTRGRTLFTDTYIKYTTDYGFTHQYYLVNQSISNSTLNLYLYNFNRTTGVSDLKITLRNTEDFAYYTNVVCKLQRFYVSEGVYRTVQMDKSGEFGLLFFNIIEENTDYRLIYSDLNNNILKTTSTLKFVCDSITSVCELTQRLTPYSGSTTSPDLQLNVVYSNTTGNITISWNDPLGLTSSVRTFVTKETMTGTSTICNWTRLGSSGSVDCDVSGYSGQVLVTVYSTASPEDVSLSKWVTLSSLKLSRYMGLNEGSIWAYGIATTLVFSIGIVSPVAAIISMLISLIVISVLGLVSAIGMAFLVLAVVLSIVVAVLIRD